MRQDRTAEADVAAAPPPFDIRPTAWGYVVRAGAGAPVLMQVAQGTLLALGAACAAGALLLVAGAAPLDAVRLLPVGILSALALLCVWFATRGGAVELQFDLARGELREIVRHRAGRPTLLGRHGLGADAQLSVVRGAGPGEPALLLLRLHGQRDGLCIAQGPEPAVQELRRRLAQDLRAGAAPAGARRLTA